MRDAKALLGLIGLAGAYFSGWFDQASTSTMIAMILVVVYVPCELVDLVVVARYRREVTNFIQSHGAEIEKAA